MGKIDEIIRVNQAGEKGAVNIYKIQHMFSKKQDISSHLLNVLTEEKTHLDYFNQQISNRKIRPTALEPIWTLGAYFLGGISSLMGTKAVMVVTEAVEDVIVDHYKEQIADLKENNSDEKDLIANLEKFMEQENEHKQQAVDNGSKNMFGYSIFYGFVKNITKFAVNVSKNI